MPPRSPRIPAIRARASRRRAASSMAARWSGAWPIESSSSSAAPATSPTCRSNACTATRGRFASERALPKCNASRSRGISSGADSPPMSERVQFSLRGHVGLLTMCDAEHFNALSPPQVRAMLDALNESKAARALVIASSAKHFCAGADIKEFLKGELLDPNRPAPVTSPVNLFRALTDDPRPVIAAVDGLAMGGGVELTVSCDLVLASEKARFALPELGLGLVPRTALARLPEIIGRRKALELILTRRRVTADEAVALGLANQKVENPLEAAVKLAEEIITAPPGAIAAVKRTLGRVPAGDWAAIHGLLAHLDPAEWREGLTAFSEKRTPDFERFWKPVE